MTTDTPTPATSRELVIPLTGEVIDLDKAATTDLCEARQRLQDLTSDAGRVVAYLGEELARRLDAANKRTATVGEWDLEANAPTTDEYLLDVLTEELCRLVEAKVLESQVVGEVIVTPPPAKPSPRVDKRELNKLKRHPDPRVRQAIGKARVRKTNRRSVRMTRKGGER